MFGSIRTKVAVSQIMMLLVGILFVGGVSYFLMDRAIKRQLEGRLSFAASTIARQTGSILQERSNLFKQISKGREIGIYQTEFKEMLLKAYLRRFRFYFSILSYVNEQGVEEVKIVEERHSEDFRDLKGEDIFLDAAWTPGQVFWSVHKDSHELEEPVIEFMIGRKAYLGEPEGFLSGFVPLREIVSPVSSFQIEETGFAVLLDEKGRVLSHPNKELILKPIQSNLDRITTLMTPRNELMRAKLTGVDGMVFSSRVPGTNWTVVVTLPYQEAVAPLITLRNISLLVILILLGTGLVVSLVVSDGITKPILMLTQVTKGIAKGGWLTEEIDIRSHDEVEQLANSFNHMMYALKRSRDELVSVADAERKKAQELEKAQDASLNIMEDLKRQRTELEKSRISLEQQTRDLKKVNLELDSFVYTASHDLRAPLRGIASFAGILEEDYRDKLGEEGKDYLNEIRKGTQKMNVLIEDLMTLSRMSRIQNPYEDVDIDELVKSVIERIEFDIHELNVDLKIQKDRPEVYCDRIKMAEVFLNLINNAIKFSSKNKEKYPKVEIRYADQGDEHQFSVKDNGIGIDPKYQDQIFGLFKRLHTDREFEGTGAGLSIVKRVIDEHQGRIWVESQLGQGTTFHFTIPKALKKPKSSGAPSLKNWESPKNMKSQKE